MTAVDEDSFFSVPVTDPEEIARAREQYRRTYGREMPLAPEGQEQQRLDEERRTA